MKKTQIYVNSQFHSEFDNRKKKISPKTEEAVASSASYVVTALEVVKGSYSKNVIGDMP